MVCARVVRPVPGSPTIIKGSPTLAERNATRRLLLTCSSRNTGDSGALGRLNTDGTDSEIMCLGPALVNLRRVILIRAK